MSEPEPNPQTAGAARDLAEVPAVEVVTAAAVHLMSAAAVKTGLADGPDAQELKDLDEARKLITALAGLVTAAAPEVGSSHAAPLRDGLRSLQLAFREASLIPDAPGKGPGEKWTGPVNCPSLLNSTDLLNVTEPCRPMPAPPSAYSRRRGRKVCRNHAMTV